MRVTQTYAYIHIRIYPIGTWPHRNMHIRSSYAYVHSLDTHTAPINCLFAWTLPNDAPHLDFVIYKANVSGGATRNHVVDITVASQPTDEPAWWRWLRVRLRLAYAQVWLQLQVCVCVGRIPCTFWWCGYWFGSRVFADCSQSQTPTWFIGLHTCISAHVRTDACINLHLWVHLWLYWKMDPQHQHPDLMKSVSPTWKISRSP